MTRTAEKTLAKVESMLREAAEKGSWGTIEIDLKEGRPYMVRQTIQSRIDEETNPNVSNNARK